MSAQIYRATYKVREYAQIRVRNITINITRAQNSIWRAAAYTKRQSAVSYAAVV